MFFIIGCGVLAYSGFLPPLVAGILAIIFMVSFLGCICWINLIYKILKIPFNKNMRRIQDKFEPKFKAAGCTLEQGYNSATSGRGKNRNFTEYYFFLIKPDVRNAANMA